MCLVFALLSRFCLNIKVTCVFISLYFCVNAGVRPYKCTLCASAFTQRCSLEAHQKKIHAITPQYAYKERRDKVYVCEECGLTAQTQDSLWNHLQDEHPQSRITAKTINCNEGKMLPGNMNDSTS